MAKEELERRILELEREVAALRIQVAGITGAKPWWERIAGTFHADPIYERAMKLGQKYRRAQGPNGNKPKT